MSTPITTFSHREHPRSSNASDAYTPGATRSSQSNYYALLSLDNSRKLTIGQHSLFYVVKGNGVVQVGFQRMNVAEGQYVLVNPVQEAQLKSQDEDSLVMLHISLTEQSLKDACSAVKAKRPDASHEICLSENGRVELCEQVFASDGTELGVLLQAWSKHAMSQESGRGTLAEETLTPLAEALVEQQFIAYTQLLQLTSAKLSTKKELYRRLCMARMHMHTHLDEALDLDTLAQVACLSKYHFIRLFKEAFGQTPRQYLIARRLERASSLLISSSKTFHEICQEVGLKDSSSFGRLFKRSFGATPHIYRQMHAAG